MKNILKGFLKNWTVTTVLFLANAIFMWFLLDTGFLTTGLAAFIIIGLLLINAFVYWLSKDFAKKIRFIISVVLTVVIIILEMLALYALNPITSALNVITTPEVERAEMGIYVRVDDPAEELKDVKNYNFGTLGTMDAEATELAVEEINTTLGTVITTTDYKSLTEMMNGLLKEKEVGVIILNKSFLEILDETEGHEKDSTKIREIHSLTIKDSETSGEAVKQYREVFTMYISGIDCYGSINRRSRSDVNIIATVNVKTGQVLLVSTPRDYYIPLSVSNGSPDKLTHAGIYGIEVSKDTLGMLYDMEIDYYFRVNFDGFEEIIDALGGIEVDSKYDFSSGEYHYTQGKNTLDGKAALAFSRERYKLPAGDRGRGENQMAVINGVIKKAASSAMLKNYRKVLKGIEGSFQTSMPYDSIAALVRNQIKNNTSWNVVSYSVNGTGTSRKTYSTGTNAYVMIPDEETVKHAKELMDTVKNGGVPTP